MEVDTTKITEGQIFDTYPELCRALGCEVYGGYQKTKQLKDFARYFKYEKSGKQYIITEIYTKPMSEEYRIAANAKYIMFVQNILLSYLSQQDNEIIYLTQQNLWMILGMINNKYTIMRTPHRREELMYLSEDMSIFDINHFFTRSNTKFRDIVKTALNSLKRRKLLLCDEVYRIGEIAGDDFFSSVMTYRDATDTERKYILRTERALLKEFGFETDYQLFSSDKRSLYYEKLEKIFQREKGWNNVYMCYKFIYDKSNIIAAINEDEEVKRMNDLIVDVLNEQAENNYKKYGVTADNMEERAIYEDRPFFYYQGYQNRQRLLTETLIRR